jgi:hypothetical protein
LYGPLVQGDTLFAAWEKVACDQSKYLEDSRFSHPESALLTAWLAANLSSEEALSHFSAPSAADIRAPLPYGRVSTASTISQQGGRR